MLGNIILQKTINIHPVNEAHALMSDGDLITITNAKRAEHS